jgi:antitoxin PrlF
VEYKVSSQGQVTLPKFVRDALGIEPGDPLEFEVRGGEFVGRKKRKKANFDQFRGILADGRSTDEIMRELRPIRAWDVE